MLGPRKLKLHFSVKGAVADYDILNSGFWLFKKQKHSCKNLVNNGIKMFVERRTSVKMDFSVFNIRVNVKGIEFPLSNWSMV